MPPAFPPHSHGTGRVAGIPALHILHLAGVHVWDRHLLELLHLAQEEGRAESEGGLILCL